ncbi:MAG: alpha/beta hydrolase [Chloroflexi bacterium]|nr:alpha/beta hydrolase [Chloroflexota bacterium]
MSAIVVREDVVHYEVLGRGPGILFIHSWLGSWRYWIPTMQALSARYRTYAIDLWGFGDSGKRLAYYDLDSQVDLIVRFMDTLGVARLALVGHGLGGVIALRFAAQYPDFVARLMTIDVPLNNASINPRLGSSNVPSLLDWLVGKTAASAEIAAESAKLDPAVIQASLKYLTDLDLSADVNQTVAPTLMVHGDKDAAIAPPSETLFDGSKPNLHSISFEDGRHFPMLDDPPKFSRLLADFLEAHDLTSLELKEEWKRRIR